MPRPGKLYKKQQKREVGGGHITESTTPASHPPRLRARDRTIVLCMAAIKNNCAGPCSGPTTTAAHSRGVVVT